MLSEWVGVSSHVVVDEVEVVAWGDGHGGASPLGQPGVGLVQSLVHVDEGIDAGLAVGGRLGQVGVHHWDHVRWDVLQGEREGGRGGRT